MDTTLSPPRQERIDEVKLENGLSMTLFDCSRRVAADRWYVCLKARIPVQVQKSDLSEEELYREFIDWNKGDTVSLEIVKERNFIDEREKDEVFSGLKQELRDHCLAYLSNDKASSGIKKRWIERFLKERTWWKGQD